MHVTDQASATKPEVWALTVYKAGSGGWNAFAGVARHFAEQAGLDLRILDPRQVRDDFLSISRKIKDNLPPQLCLDRPTGRRPNWFARDRAMTKTSSELFFEQYGTPAAILTCQVPFFRKEYHQGTKIFAPAQTFVADLTNWNDYLPDTMQDLVPHGQSAKDLKEQARRFKTLLKPDDKPLITLVLAESDGDCNIGDGFGNLARRHPDARFLLASSPRCPSWAFSRFCDKFASCLRPDQADNLIRFDFQADRKEDNPYKAALTLADHMIIVGQSESMVSDLMMTGRTAYYAYGYGPEITRKLFATPLVDSGKIKYFPTADALCTERFAPIDTTAAAGDHLAIRYAYWRPMEKPEQDFVGAAMQAKMKRAASNGLATFAGP